MFVLAFLYMFLWFYVSFSILESFWKENWRKEPKLGENEQNQTKLQITEKLKAG